MSDLTPHLRLLRAEADALSDVALSVDNDLALRGLLEAQALAKRNAASFLEAEEAAMQARFINREQNVHYNPKGKP